VCPVDESREPSSITAGGLGARGEAADGGGVGARGHHARSGDPMGRAPLSAGRALLSAGGHAMRGTIAAAGASDDASTVRAVTRVRAAHRRDHRRVARGFFSRRAARMRRMMNANRRRDAAFSVS
jgi:hypothetical protein